MKQQRRLTQKEVATIQGVDIRTVHRWRHNHGLPDIREGRRVYIGSDDLLQWIRQRAEALDQRPGTEQ